MLLSLFSFELRLVVRLGVNCLELQLTQLAISLMRFTAHGFLAHGYSLLLEIIFFPYVAIAIATYPTLEKKSAS